jgi:hypothetical protein
MDYNQWGWLLIALGLIGLGVSVAMVVKMPAKPQKTRNLGSGAAAAVSSMRQLAQGPLHTEIISAR